MTEEAELFAKYTNARTKIENWREGVEGCKPPTEQDRIDIAAWEGRNKNHPTGKT